MSSKHCSCKTDEDSSFYQNHGCCQACYFLDGTEDEGFDSLMLSGDEEEV